MAAGEAVESGVSEIQEYLGAGTVNQFLEGDAHEDEEGGGEGG